MKVAAVLALGLALLCMSEAGDDCEGKKLPLKWIRGSVLLCTGLRLPKCTFLIICVFYLPPVCIGLLNRLKLRLEEKGMTSSTPEQVEVELVKVCKEAKGKDERFVSHLSRPSTSPLSHPLTHEVVFSVYCVPLSLNTVLLYWCCRNLCYQTGERGDQAHVLWQAPREDLCRS